MNSPSEDAHHAENRRTNVLLEEIRSDFRGFGDKLGALGSKVDSMEVAVKELDERVERIELVLNPLAKDVKRNTDAIERIDKRLELVEIRPS